MTSRHWKELREKRDFRRQLKEFWEGTTLVSDLRIDEELERLHEEDCRNGFFDDDDDWNDGGIDDWDDDPWRDDDDDEHYRYYCRDYGFDDDLDSPGLDDVKPLPGWHIRMNDDTYLVLCDGRWANILTGGTVGGADWTDRENVIFGL